MNNQDDPAFKKLNPNHPLVGYNYRLLREYEVLQKGDQTARTSLLFSREHFETWRPIDDDIVGHSIMDTLANDVDASERVFRRFTFFVDFSAEGP